MLPLLVAMAAAYAVGRSQGPGRAAGAAPRQLPAAPPVRPQQGPAEAVFGPALEFSLVGRQAMVGDVTAPVQVFTDAARRKIESRLRLSSLVLLDVTDVPDARFFQLVPLGEKSALQAIEEAEAQGIHVFASLSCTLDAAYVGDYLRIIAWADSARPSFWRSREFARLRTPTLVPEVQAPKPVAAAPVEPVTEVAKPKAKAAKAAAEKPAVVNGTNGAHKVEGAEPSDEPSPAARE